MGDKGEKVFVDEGASDGGLPYRGATPALVAAPTPRLVQFLRKLRGQIDRPPRKNIVEIDSKTGEIQATTSESDSDNNTSLGNLQQARGQAYAEGGLTKFYVPIPEYEGRHRWDPRAEWTPAEEKRLVRKVIFQPLQDYGDTC